MLCLCWMISMRTQCCTVSADCLILPLQFRWIKEDIDDGFSKGSLRVRNATNTRLQYHLQEIQAELITAWGLRYRSLMNVHFIFQHSVWGLKHIGSLDWPPWIDLTYNMFRLRKELISPITVFPIPASKVLNCRASWDMGTGNTQLKTIKHTCSYLLWVTLGQQ